MFIGGDENLYSDTTSCASSDAHQTVFVPLLGCTPYWLVVLVVSLAFACCVILCMFLHLRRPCCGAHDKARTGQRPAHEEVESSTMVELRIDEEACKRLAPPPPPSATPQLLEAEATEGSGAKELELTVCRRVLPTEVTDWAKKRGSSFGSSFGSSLSSLSAYLTGRSAQSFQELSEEYAAARELVGAGGDDRVPDSAEAAANADEFEALARLSATLGSSAESLDGIAERTPQRQDVELVDEDLELPKAGHPSRLIRAKKHNKQRLALAEEGIAERAPQRQDVELVDEDLELPKAGHPSRLIRAKKHNKQRLALAEEMVELGQEAEF